MSEWGEIENRRLELQASLDAQKTSEDRNRMGQFATPTALAREIVAHGLGLLGDREPIRFLDPGIGTGAFFSALRALAPSDRVSSATGYEIDPHYGAPAAQLWRDHGLDLRLQDFTNAQPGPDDLANLLISNPPYVRHHHLDAATKERLAQISEDASGVRINGLSGLYCYFMAIAHRWMAPGAIAAWLVPSEFMGVNYGQQIKRYLLRRVSLLQIHRYDPADVQFSDALVSSAVVWFRNTPPTADHEVAFTYGGTLGAPALRRMVPSSVLASETKWTRYPQADAARPTAEITIGDLFDVKRGLATGDNGFFIMDRAEIERRGLAMECFRPVLPGSRHLPHDVIEADANGWPRLDKQLFLLDPRIDEDELARRFPSVAAYLATGKGTVSETYLCRSRRPWFSQETRPPAPIICTYMGRSRKGAKPFRFILNHSNATACNTYLMLYPKPKMAKVFDADPNAKRIAWEFLNAIETDDLLGHGRVYGGGLHKLEPKELRGMPADGLVEQLPGLAPSAVQLSFLGGKAA